MVKISVNQRYCLIKTEDAKVVLRLIEGNVLNYKKTIPTDNAYSVIIPVNSVMESVERCEPIISLSETKSPVRLQFTKTELVIKCSTSTGEIIDTLPIPFEGEETEIGFNHKYFHDALKACEEDLAKIEFNSNISPCIIKPVEGDSFVQMVLPVKLKNENWKNKAF